MNLLFSKLLWFDFLLTRDFSLEIAELKPKAVNVCKKIKLFVYSSLLFFFLSRQYLAERKVEEKETSHFDVIFIFHANLICLSYF